MKIYISILFIALLSSLVLLAQTQPFSLEDCIEYALENSTDIDRSQNNLRKYIEQACTDLQTAQSTYAALQEQLGAEQDSYDVADEMFSQGMVNSVDFLLSKNNMTKAEISYTQAK